LASIIQRSKSSWLMSLLGLPCLGVIIILPFYLVFSGVILTSWRPAAAPRKAAAADQDPDQGEDLQLGPRGHGGHGGVLAPAAAPRKAAAARSGSGPGRGSAAGDPRVLSALCQAGTVCTI
jgi:uncharacterized membrane protein